MSKIQVGTGPVIKNVSISTKNYSDNSFTVLHVLTVRLAKIAWLHEKIALSDAFGYQHLFTRDAPSLQFGYGFDSDDTAVLVTIVGTLISPVGEACPRIPRLEMKTFHERVFHRFGSIPRNGTGVMRDEFVLAIVTGVGVPEMA